MINLLPVTVKILLIPLRSLQKRLDAIEIHNPQLARLLCQVIPAQCPFERTIHLSERWVLHIPPLCKLNPFYDQLVALRFKSLVYLTEVEGISG